MPINMMIAVKGSVGTQGKNHKDDVRAVQRQLNSHMNPPRKPLVEDGISGKKTEGTIRDFQRCVLGFRHPDGRVDPGGKTQRALNNPASEGKWAGMSMAPADYSPHAAPSPTDAAKKHTISISHLPIQEQKAVEKLFTEIETRPRMQANKPASKAITNLLATLLDEQYKDAKARSTSLAVLITAMKDGKLASLGNGLLEVQRHLPSDGKRLARWLVDSVRLNGVERVFTGLTGVGSNPGLTSKLNRLGGRMDAVGFVFCAIEVVKHLRKGDWGPATKEIVKTGFGYRIPIAGAVDGVFSVIDHMYPDLGHLDKGHPFYIVLKQINILDHVGNTGDILATFVELVVDSVQKGTITTSEFDDLVKRLKSSSLGATMWTIEDITKKLMS